MRKIKLAQNDDLHISPFREDGKTYGTPTWIWSVVVDNDLYVRAHNGQNSRWYKSAMKQKAGRITAVAKTKEVSFEPVNGPVNDRIDDAYRAKYKGSPYLNPMIGTRARAATVKVTPLDRVVRKRERKTMKVGILGSGDVAKSLARGFLKEGHEVMLGSREPGKLDSWVRESGKGANSGTFAETAKFGDLVLIAVHGAKAVDALQIAAVDNFKGKVVIDATNPLDMSGGLPKLIGGLGSSSGELIQESLPGAFVVKAFNTVGNAHFYKPDFAGGPPDMFLCGDDAKAKELVSQICKDFGWNPIDVGGIALSHYLEAAAMVWIITAFTGGHWNQAFKLLRK